MLLELPHVAAPEHVREKRKTEQTLGLRRFVEDGSWYLYYIAVLFFLCGSDRPIIQQMAHWQETVCGMRGKFHQVRLCRAAFLAPLSWP